MLNIFFTILFVSFLNAGLIMVASKWGIFDWWDLNRKKWMPKRCDFCLGFWLAFIELPMFYFYFINFEWFTFLMIIPFALCSAVLSRFVSQGNC